MNEYLTPSHYEDDPRQHVPQFIVLDMDNTLLESNQLTPYLGRLFQLDDSERMALDATVEAQSGKGFNTLSYLCRYYGDRVPPALRLNGNDGDIPPDYEYIAETMLDGLDIEACQAQLIKPGARQLVDALAAHDLPYSILTTGDEVYQNVKLAVIKRLLNQPQLLSRVVSEGDVPDKTAMIDALWNQDEGNFSLWNGYAAERVVVVDDKLSNLATAHDNIHCVHIGTHDLSELATAVQHDGFRAFLV